MGRSFRLTPPDVPFRLRLALTALLLLTIVILSVTPGVAQPGDGVFVWIVVATPKLLQKSLHVIAYAAFASMLWWTLENRLPMVARTAIALVIAASAGAILEWWQLFVPGRVGNLTDVLLNSVGAILGILLALLIIRSDTPASRP